MSSTHIALEPLLRMDKTGSVMLRLVSPPEHAPPAPNLEVDLSELETFAVLQTSSGSTLGDEMTGAGAAGEDEEGAVLVAGRKVWEYLTRHQGVRDALQRAAAAGSGERSTIMIECAVPVAEGLPWEALRHPEKGFLALDERWPVVRLAGAPRSGRVLSRVVRTPLRIAAILAAEERDPVPEWQAMRGALNACPFPWEAKLFTSHRELLERVRRSGEANVVADWVPSEETELMSELEAFAPHLLHFFCHGSAQYDTPYLAVATRSSVELGNEPLYLNDRTLIGSCKQVLLVVLNACQGAVPAGHTHSLASGMVRDGVPAAVGMRESVDSTDAHYFTKAIYGEVMTCLGSHLGESGEVELDWATVLQKPRSALCSRYPGPKDVVAEARAAWTLPVLYVRPDTLVVQKVGPTAAGGGERTAHLVGALSALREQRATLHPQTPAILVQQINGAIAEVEAALRGGTREAENGDRQPGSDPARDDEHEGPG